MVETLKQFNVAPPARAGQETADTIERLRSLGYIGGGSATVRDKYTEADDPKRLAADGLATATEEYTGRRKRTVYAITAKGRRALEEWLRTPSAEPSWENEAMVKVFFADGGDLDSLRDTLLGMQETARRRLAELSRMASGEPLFPERRHLGALTIRLAQDLGPGHTIVTILADFGTRYQSKLFNPEFLRSKGLPAPDWL